jgi:hypothetical protein
VALKSRKIYAFFSRIVYVYIFSNKNFLHAHFLAEFRGTGRNFGSYMRTTTMEDSQGSYNHERNSKGYMSSWEMLRHNLMEEEESMSL